MDKRGKHSKHVNSEDFKKFYDLSDSEKDSESEEELKTEDKIELKDEIIKKPKIPNARGIDSSEESGSDVSTSSDSDDSCDESEQFDHKWNEWDKDVPQTQTATKRLAICNIDWDRINANDLYVLFNSFKHSNGSILSVKIFPSEMGLKRMKAEEECGPIQFISDSNDQQNQVLDDDNEDEEVVENSSRTTEQVRKYQMSRLQYFYGVIECDTEETADQLYKELDGMEYESSSSTLDLRFIPEDMVFDEQNVKTECYSMPDFSTYKAPQFINTALQQSKVTLTWDETDPKRKDVFERAFDKEADDDLKAYLASSSSEDNDEELDSNYDSVLEMKDCDKINKYKQLLNSFNENKDENDIEMEISWEPNLKDVAEDIINKKEREKNISTFEENYNKQKQKRKEKTVADKELESESDDKQDSKDKNVKQRHKKGGKKRDAIEKSEDHNLELLLMDASENSKSHFNYTDIIENENNKKKKQKLVDDNFKFNAMDPRFKAVYTSHHYNVDPSDPHFKKTNAFNEIMSRTTKKNKSNEFQQMKSELDEKEPNNKSSVNSWSQLVRSVKNKTKINTNKQKNFQSNRFKS